MNTTYINIEKIFIIIFSMPESSKNSKFKYLSLLLLKVFLKYIRPESVIISIFIILPFTKTDELSYILQINNHPKIVKNPKTDEKQKPTPKKTIHAVFNPSVEYRKINLEDKTENFENDVIEFLKKSEKFSNPTGGDLIAGYMKKIVSYTYEHINVNTLYWSELISEFDVDEKEYKNLMHERNQALSTIYDKALIISELCGDLNLKKHILQLKQNLKT